VERLGWELVGCVENSGQVPREHMGTMLPLAQQLGDIKGNGGLLDKKKNTEERGDGEEAGQEKEE